MKLFLKLGMVLALTLGSSIPAGADSAAGGDHSGGGHGIATPDGIVLLDDYVPVPTAVCKDPEAVDVLAHPLTREAAESLLSRLRLLSPKLPHVATNLEALFLLGSQWWLCPNLPSLSDADYEMPLEENLLQGAIQSADRQIYLNQELLERARSEKTGLRYVEGLLAHELFLGFMGLSVDRPSLRALVRALRDPRGPRTEEVEVLLNQISPYFVEGRFVVELFMKHNGKPANWKDRDAVHPYDSGFSFVDCVTGKDLFNGMWIIAGGSESYARPSSRICSKPYLTGIPTSSGWFHKWKPSLISYEVRVNNVVRLSGSFITREKEPVMEPNIRTFYLP